MMKHTVSETTAAAYTEKRIGQLAIIHHVLNRYGRGNEHTRQLLVACERMLDDEIEGHLQMYYPRED